ncbi:MAG: YlbF family regulator [Clostridia bacterium]|nr:YlbF family regulator [Clostridia bacterium]
MDILAKAKELAEMLNESEEAKRADAAKKAQDTDINAQAMIKKYNEKRRDVAVKMQFSEHSQDEMEEMRREINEAFDELMTNEVVKEFVEASKEYDMLVQQVVSVVTGQGGGCGGSCSSCSGCH